MPNVLVAAWLVMCPALALAQAPEASSRSVALGVGFNYGKFGNWDNGGVAVSAAVWQAIASVAALRADVGYAFRVNNADFGCNAIDFPCPPRAPRHIPTIGASAMLGNLAGTSTRYYALAGAEMMFLRNKSEAAKGQVVVPKFGAGMLHREKHFVEVSGRWRSDWGGRPLWHALFVVGWYR
jgi:hypothetical protein